MRRLNSVLALCVIAPLMWAVPAHASETSCQQVVDPDRRCYKIHVLGHRAKGGDNENTLQALAKDGEVGSGYETDAWQLRTGPPVVFHDEYPCRVVDKNTLPAGTSCKTPIYNFTLAQFRVLRTKGDDPQPLPTLQEWLKFAGQHHIPGIIEKKVRAGVPTLEAAQVTAYVEHWHADASIYEVPKCDKDGVINTDMDDFGLKVGVKNLGGCRPSVEDMANAGYSFIITALANITRSYVVEVHHYGMLIGNYDSGQHETWAALAQAGADISIVPKPGKAMTWFFG